jgi:hypothetical protein
LVSPYKQAIGVARMMAGHVMQLAKTSYVLRRMAAAALVRLVGIDVVMYLRLVGVIVQYMVNIMENLPVVIETQAADVTIVSGVLLVDVVAALAHHKHCLHPDKRRFCGRIFQRAEPNTICWRRHIL